MLKLVKHVLHVFTHNALFTVVAVTAAAVYSLSVAILAYIVGLFLHKLLSFFLTAGNCKTVLLLALVITVSL